jgi:hypothetical protein
MKWQFDPVLGGTYYFLDLMIVIRIEEVMADDGIYVHEVQRYWGPHDFGITKEDHMRRDCVSAARERMRQNPKCLHGCGKDYVSTFDVMGAYCCSNMKYKPGQNTDGLFPKEGDTVTLDLMKGVVEGKVLLSILADRIEEVYPPKTTADQLCLNILRATDTTTIKEVEEGFSV